MKHCILLILVSYFFFSCGGNAQISREKSDLTFSKTYDKYVENEFDYDGRDTILKRFKKELSISLSDEKLKDYFFPIWDEKQAVSISNDSLLTILSWDWRNNGTFHIYESMYRFVKDEIIYTGFLFEDNADQENSLSAVYFETFILPDNSYLVKGWGTHGGGKEFFIFRNLKLKDGKLQDCSSCFNGENKFFYEISRGQDYLEPKYDTTKNEIFYHELKEGFIDGDKDEPSGFMDSTGKILKLKFKKGMFIATDQ